MMLIMKRIGKVIGTFILLVLVVVSFNYLRHYVFWLPTENVAFESDGVQIKGTLIKPSKVGLFPAVVMLHGSGPDVTGDLYYRATANSIARNGLAVLLYDKRGVGKSGGDFESALYSDFVADAIAAVNFLADRDDIDARNIGLQGNSEGGWFTPEVAYTSNQVAFIFNRVGPPLSWIETVLWEARNDFLAYGVAESDVDSFLSITKRRWEYYISVADDPSLAAGAERDAINAELKRLRRVPFADVVLPEALDPYDKQTYADLAANYRYDPRPFLEAIDVPMIYTFGEIDINIPTAQSVEYLEAFRAEYDKDIEIVVFEGVGHPMANWTGLFSVGIVPAYLDLVGTWWQAKIVR